VGLLVKILVAATKTEVTATNVVGECELKSKLSFDSINSIEFLPAEELNLAGNLYTILKYCNLLSVRAVAEVSV